jgi:hypothetical protein
MVWALARQVLSGFQGDFQLTHAVCEAEKAILRYLITHRDARDSIEGIERWWLPQSKEYGTGVVAQALDRLESLGLIMVWKSVSAKPVYGLRSYPVENLPGHLRGLEK